ncbi:alpha/beta hydrolase [Clavibacter sp. Sh2141]|uniref:alpha/beta hydrolase n=1 Tax=Clavibacter sp. Sh2141 TaxID=3395374 RepID=UPI0039BD7809
MDAQLAALIADLPQMPSPSIEALAQMRPFATSPAETVLAGRTLSRREFSTHASDGFELPISVFGSPATPTGAPCIYWLHGGGMIMGDRFSQLDIPLDWLEEFHAAVVTIDYRLAPENSGSTLVEDAYQGLLWIVQNADQIGIDPGRIIVAGTSAGGGLAAGVALLARDRGGPALAAQVLICPMLDHRNITTSSHQYSGAGVWSREMNEFAWRAVLGDPVGPDTLAYVSPASAEDVSGLPAAYIDAGSAEVFRDEDVEYARRIWTSGGQAELHVWAGGFHGFDALFPGAPISRSARRARSDWVGRVLRN